MLILNYIYFMINLIDSIDSVMETKIVGGHYRNISEFPHAAFLSITPNMLSAINPSWVCGSSIINQRLLLTAAHCLDDCVPHCYMTACTGETKIDKGLKSSVSQYLIHDDYVEETATNDIAMVKLKTAIILGPKVSRIALMKNPPYKEKAEVAGWGMIDEDREIIGNKLKSVVQYYIETEKCDALLNSSTPNGTFCASSNSVDHYASGGDSGSALVVRGYIQIGLVSYKKPLLNRHVVVYTDTGYFYDWINTNTNTLICYQDELL